jgi:hypothetical protein
VTERDNVAVRAISGDPLLCGEWAGGVLVTRR